MTCTFHQTSLVKTLCGVSKCLLFSLTVAIVTTDHTSNASRLFSFKTSLHSSFQYCYYFVISAANFCWKPSFQRCRFCIMLLPQRYTFHSEFIITPHSVFKVALPRCLNRFLQRSLLFRKQNVTVSAIAIVELPCLQTKDFDISVLSPHTALSNESITLRLRHFPLTI